MSYDVEVQLVAIKAYFMNEIYEREETWNKSAESPGKDNDTSKSALIDILKSQVCILQQQNFFMKSELHQKQIIIEKLLDTNKNQRKNNCPSNGTNQNDKRQSVKKVVLIKWLINLVKEKETPIMNISETPVMIATIIRDMKLL